MRNHLRHFLLMALLAFAYSAVAQTTLKGKVVDAENAEPLIGATVSVTGTQTGTVTDMDGNFELRVSTSKFEIEFKYLGYKDKTMRITQKGMVDLGEVALSPDSKV